MRFHFKMGTPDSWGAYIVTSHLVKPDLGSLDRKRSKATLNLYVLIIPRHLHRLWVQALESDCELCNHWGKFRGEPDQSDLQEHGKSSWSQSVWRQQSDAISFVFFLTFLNAFFFICIWERERQSASRGGGRERRRHRIRSRLQALSSQHRARRGAQTHRPWDHDRSWSWTLNRLSHQAPQSNAISKGVPIAYNFCRSLTQIFIHSFKKYLLNQTVCQALYQAVGIQ